MDKIQKSDLWTNFWYRSTKKGNFVIKKNQKGDTQ